MNVVEFDRRLVLPPPTTTILQIDGEELYRSPNEEERAPFLAEVPHELSVAEIKDVVESYGLCARRAKEAGFDGVEVHAANGYLIDQFLQTCSNVRDDAYGGSAENRFRFCKEVVERVLQEFPPSRVGVKISPNGVFNGMGSEGNFTDFLYFADQLEKQFKIAYLHCMDGLGFGYHNKASVVELEDLRKVFKGTLIGNVGYTRESAAAKVESGAANHSPSF